MIKNRVTKAKALFATDTMYIHNRFNGLNYVCIEANYSREALKQARDEEITDLGKKKYVINNHMALETAEEFFKANDTSQLKEVWLLHASDDNSDVKEFKERIKRVTGARVYIA